jgi:tripartite ATP-independent transporter DctP family solute receptor
MLGWAAQVKRESGGRMEIQVFPGSTLGSDPAMLSQVRIGGLEFAHMSGAILSGVVPVTAIDNVAFAFQKPEDPWKALDGELGAYVRGEVEKSGIHIFDKVIDLGLKVWTSNGPPINLPDDLKGKKFRVPPSKIIVSMMSAFGSTPVSLSVAEVYAAAKNHLVDGIDTDLLDINADKFYECQKYVSIVHQRWAGQWMIANMDAWNKLPKKLQDLVSRAYNQAATRERKTALEAEEGLQPKLEQQGMVFNTPPSVAPFRNVLRNAGYYSEWKAAFGPRAWSLLEKYCGTLA